METVVWCGMGAVVWTGMETVVWCGMGTVVWTGIETETLHEHI